MNEVKNLLEVSISIPIEKSSVSPPRLRPAKLANPPKEFEPAELKIPDAEARVAEDL